VKIHINYRYCRLCSLIIIIIKHLFIHPFEDRKLNNYVHRSKHDAQLLASIIIINVFLFFQLFTCLLTWSLTHAEQPAVVENGQSPCKYNVNVTVKKLNRCLVTDRLLRLTACTGWVKKVNPKCSTHNFVKYWPILKILSPLQSPENLQRSGH